jgi:alkanesulfonate monooxygenase SsuD/methylene tetrahydromethanopterin reductase-like flavin-dependent oxidoreductase (luciferase family)
MTEPTKFGIVLPHFGPHSETDFILDTAATADELGFDSVWVRDHLYIPPENREHGGITEQRFVEGIQTLSAASAVTEDVTLATGVTIPIRHPLILAQNMGTLSYLSDDRVICSLGAGAHEGEFDALDIPFDERGQIVRETFEILRAVFDGEDVAFDGEMFQFENVTIDPGPSGDLPLWYGGQTTFSVKRASLRADGWLASRMPRRNFEECMDILDEREREYGETTTVGYQIPLSVDRDGQAARDRVDPESFIHEAQGFWPDQGIETVEDIRGYFIAGTPAECAEQLQELVDMGVEHFALDMRHSFTRMDENFELLVDEVLPNVS